MRKEERRLSFSLQPSCGGFRRFCSGIQGLTGAERQFHLVMTGLFIVYL